jgi:acetyltransferase-like isoleucine patch superfamily enzyme
MINPYAIVQTEDIGDGVDIAEFAVVRSDVRIGRGVRIHPHVVIESGVELGDGVEIFPGAHLGKPPKGAGATARTMEFERRVRVGSGTSIGPHAVIFYDVTVGADTLIGDGASIREKCRIGSRCIIGRYVTMNYNSTVGDRTRIMDLTHITGNCTVGDDVFISVLVSTTNDNEMVSRSYAEGKNIGPHIGDKASIGAGASLLPGIRIGEGALVGAGSVVTKDVDPYALVMGVPAKFVRNVDRNHL